MQPFTKGEKFVVDAVVAVLVGVMLAACDVHLPWYGYLAIGGLIVVVVGAYCALYNAVLSR